MDAIVLAGGLGMRMGGLAKAFLTLGGRTFIQRILDTLAPLVNSVCVSTNSPDAYRHLGVRIVEDPERGRGPLMGIMAGLRASTEDACFVVAADAPLLQPGLVRLLGARARDWDAVVPVWEDRFEPLCAVYSRGCLPEMERTLDQGRVVSFFPFVRVCSVPEAEVKTEDPEGLSFANVNTQEDLERLQMRVIPPRSRNTR
jgi:molybdopterin-guanine dinucleotide biosynthesis protein A